MQPTTYNIYLNLITNIKPRDTILLTSLKASSRVDELLKGKESKADLKPHGEQQSRKRLRQWVSHGVRRNK